MKNIDDPQQNMWESNFGDEYTDRNMYYDPHYLDQEYINRFGTSRADIENEFFSNLDIKNVLEIGCNCGDKLVRFVKIHPNVVAYGVDINDHAIDAHKKTSVGLNIYVVKGSAFDVPFKDHIFDLVMTNGLLIHINPYNLSCAISEIYRCSSRYIFGYEYYNADGVCEVTYRNNANMMWKQDFSKLFTKYYPALSVVKSKIYFKNESEKCIAYLLENKHVSK